MSSFQRNTELAKQFSRYNYAEHAQELRKAFERFAGLPPGSLFVIDTDLLESTLQSCLIENYPHYRELIDEVITHLRLERGERQHLASLTPIRLLRDFYTVIAPPRALYAHRRRLREVGASTIGHLVLFNGVITFISQVIPECQVAAFSCEACGGTQYVVIPHDTFLPPRRCDSQVCQERGVLLAPVYNTSLSAINSLNIAVVQELPSEVPDGEVPRTLAVHIRDLLQRSESSMITADIRPGDVVTLWGTLLPAPVAGTVYRMEPVFQAEGWQRIGSESQATGPSIDFIELRANTPDLHSLLLASFAPKIHGRRYEKLACLCSLVGGNDVQTPDMKMRGSINTLLVGDPGCAKSALLRFSCAVSERSVYIAGRGASGAGLTTAVVRVAGTTDIGLEGGALVMADQGVCALDELDKIAEEDRTAIYEVLEQGTVSIAKAGITATLNARTTVIAAANPYLSTWDETLSVKQNLNIPEALISRFDVVYIIRDKVHSDEDTSLAIHVADLHTRESAAAELAPQADERGIQRLTERQLQEYLKHAKMLTPVVGPELLRRYVDSYLEDRREKEVATPRALLSTIRISQALAKLRLSPAVELGDIIQARELLKAADASACAPKRTTTQPTRTSAAIATDCIRRVLARASDGMPLAQLRQEALAAGAPEAELDATISRQLALNLLRVDDNGNYHLL